MPLLVALSKPRLIVRIDLPRSTSPPAFHLCMPIEIGRPRDTRNHLSKSHCCGLAFDRPTDRVQPIATRSPRPPLIIAPFFSSIYLWDCLYLSAENSHSRSINSYFSRTNEITASLVSIDECLRSTKRRKMRRPLIDRNFLQVYI